MFLFVIVVFGVQHDRMPVSNILPSLSGLGIMLGLKSVKVIHPLVPPRQALRQLVWLSAPWISTPEYPTPVQLLLQGEGSQGQKEGWRIWLKKGQGRYREQKDSACMMPIDCVHGELGNSSRLT